MPEHPAGFNGDVTCVVAGNIATVTLNRPERKNAITADMWATIANLFEGFGSHSEIRAIIIRGEGKDFSAGADISEFDSVRGDAVSARAYEYANSRAFAAIRNAPVPVIAAIRGICFGGGFAIAAACDIRVASHEAYFSIPAARLGIAYPLDAIADAAGSCGPQMARYMLYTAARISAADAAEAGFLFALHEEATLEGAANELAELIAKNAPLSVRVAKAAISGLVHGSAEHTAIAAKLVAATFNSSDYAEGRAAFREKRAPTFSGN